MICKNCGAEVKDGELFCGSCGMKCEEPNQNYYQGTNNSYQNQNYYQSSAPIYVPVEKPNATLWIILSAI